VQSCRSNDKDTTNIVSSQMDVVFSNSQPCGFNKSSTELPHHERGTSEFILLQPTIPMAVITESNVLFLLPVSV
jgi:hypothetical protein